MPNRTNSSNDYEDRFFTMLMDRMDKQDRKLDLIHDETRKTNGRVTKLETRVTALEKADPTPSRAVRTTPIYKDPKVIQIFSYVALAIVLIVGALFKVNLSGIL